MSISDEFKQAVRDKNLLRVRIMLKDSLLIDKTFKLFNEMREYASDNGVSPWAEKDASIPFERAEKPWTVDTMNYELAALVNDFTLERTRYVAKIIRDIYKPTERSCEAAVSHSPASQSSKNMPGPKQNQINTPKNDLWAANTETINKRAMDIHRIVKKNKDFMGKIHPSKEDISDIERYAQEIVSACNKIKRGY